MATWLPSLVLRGFPGSDREGMQAAAEASNEAVRDRLTWSELFYDLVLVFAVTQAATVLAQHPGWTSLGRSLLILAPLWWAWVGLALLVNAAAESGGQRLLILATAAVTFIAAVAAPRSSPAGPMPCCSRSPT